MRTALTTCTVVFVSALLALSATAADKTAAKTASKNGPFEKIKALSGEWEVKHEGGDHGEHGGTITYKITAGGSAVLETLFGGTDHEMVTMYYMEGDQLALTHYCMLHNRPHMHAQKQSSPAKIVFECNDDHEDNAKIENEDHMHKATFNFVDADHLKTEWVLYKDGKPDSTHSFELVRKKAKKS
jgi:hypothetical protein